MTLLIAEFYLYEQFNKGEKLRQLGLLYKVKPLIEEEITRPLLARVVNFQKIKQNVIDSIIKEALTLKLLECKYLLPIEGIIFNKKSHVMHIFYP